MKTSEYTFTATIRGNIKVIAIFANGVEKRSTETRINSALDMSGRVCNAIINLDEGEKLTITCKLKENGDN